MTLKFGTDGVRGVANHELTPELALTLGRAAARVLGGRRWLIGSDTRRSGTLLSAALAAGLATEGAQVVDLGVVPTPGVAFLSARESSPAAMISASHNAFGDNGIKIFAAGGKKLSDEIELQLEAELAVLSSHGDPRPRPSGEDVGTITHDPTLVDAYQLHLESEVVQPGALSGLKVVLDCANGASSAMASSVFTHLGAHVSVLHNDPNGININAECGSTYPRSLQDAVVEMGADVGLAFDGDADRVLAVDATGNMVDGDEIIGICAIDLHSRSRLAHDTVVVTVMANLGFHQSMASHGIKVVSTDVGDRYVLAALDAGGYVLGGEQSGHVIFRDLASTGDGMLSGICLLDVMARSNKTLGELASEAMVRLPQVLVNVRLAKRQPSLMEELTDEIQQAKDSLGDRGRVLVRASGTEPVIRVMVEAPTEQEAQSVAQSLARIVQERGAQP